MLPVCVILDAFIFDFIGLAIADYVPQELNRFGLAGFSLFVGHTDYVEVKLPI